MAQSTERINSRLCQEQESIILNTWIFSSQIDRIFLARRAHVIGSVTVTVSTQRASLGRAIGETALGRLQHSPNFQQWNVYPPSSLHEVCSSLRRFGQPCLPGLLALRQNGNQKPTQRILRSSSAGKCHGTVAYLRQSNCCLQLVATVEQSSLGSHRVRLLECQFCLNCSDFLCHLQRLTLETLDKLTVLLSTRL